MLWTTARAGSTEGIPVAEDVIDGPAQAVVQGSLGHLHAGVHVSARVRGLQDPQIVLHGADQVRQVHWRCCKGHMARSPAHSYPGMRPASDLSPAMIHSCEEDVGAPVWAWKRRCLEVSMR